MRTIPVGCTGPEWRASTYVGSMTHHDPDSTGHDQHDDEGDSGTVSEAGSSSLNPDTALGGADSVPDTPDVNDSGEHGAHDVNVSSDEPAE